jgi:hypothetical protein
MLNCPVPPRYGMTHRARAEARTERTQKLLNSSTRAITPPNTISA